jgi:hypothetical protein
MKKKQKFKKESWNTSWVMMDVDPSFENPFGWENSPQGELAELAMHVTFDQLEAVTIDARQRHLIWPDGQCLSLIESAARIHTEEPELPAKLIESKIISWLESFAPESYTPAQLDELDRLTEQWIDDHYRLHPPD